MATISKKLDLVYPVWQLVSAGGFIGQRKENNQLEIVNADSLPSGDVEEAQVVNQGVNLNFSAPATGSLYARVSEGETTLRYYEV